MNRIKKAHIIFVIKGLVTLILLLNAFRRIDFALLVELIEKINHIYFFFVIPLIIASFVIGTYTFYVLLMRQGLNVTFKEVLYIYMTGGFFSSLPLGTIGGDAVIMYYLSRRTKEMMKTMICLIMTRYIGFLSFSMLLMLAIIFDRDMLDIELKYSLFIFLLAFNGIALFIVLNKKLNLLILNKLGLASRFNIDNNRNKRILGLLEAFDNFRSKKSVLSITLLFSIIFHLNALLWHYLILISLGIEIDIIYFILSVIIVSFLTMLPFTIGGLGLREMSYKMLFLHAGIPSYKAVSFSIIVSLVYFISYTISGIIYLIKLRSAGTCMECTTK